MAKPGKRLRKARETLEAGKLYPLAEAVARVKKNAAAKFDENIDVAIRLTVDPKQSDQSVRGTVAMPNGLGKQVRVAVFARGDKAEEARKAGADVVGAEDLVAMVEKGDMPFERCIASPDMMALVGKVGKILGPRGLMPNPKLGTVTPNVAGAVKEAKSGQVEFRLDKGGIVHAGIGKASFSEAAIIGNIKALVDALNKAKPQGVKGALLKKFSLSSTMGPGVTVELGSLKEVA